MKVNFGAGLAGLTSRLILACVFPEGENVVVATLCHKSGSGHVQHLNIMLLTSARYSHPSFFGKVQGSTGDVSAMTMAAAGSRRLCCRFLKRRMEIEQTLSLPFPSVQLMFLTARSSSCQPVFRQLPNDNEEWYTLYEAESI